MAPTFGQVFLASGRLNAFLIHIGCSAFAVGCIGALMLWLWFPQPWFVFEGGWFVFRIILLVDVVLGPLLTLIVYQRGKPNLQRDLSIIVALQVCALAFGVTTMYQHRPAFVVYGANNFFTVTWAELRERTRDLASLDQFKSSRGPGIVMIRPPGDPAGRAAYRALLSQPDALLVSHGDYFDRIGEDDWTAIFGKGPRMEELAKQDPAIMEDLRRFRERNVVPEESLGFVPVVCRRGVIMLIIDRRTKRIVDWLS